MWKSKQRLASFAGSHLYRTTISNDEMMEPPNFRYATAMSRSPACRLPPSPHHDNEEGSQLEGGY